MFELSQLMHFAFEAGRVGTNARVHHTPATIAHAPNMWAVATVAAATTAGTDATALYPKPSALP